MRRIRVLSLGLILLASALAVAADGQAPVTPPATQPTSARTAADTQPANQVRQVDLAICLDTSGSMDGLIDSAKQKLWAVVNELATAKPRPLLRVALYQYGNDGLQQENGWVQRVCDLTDDLDTVYEKLFALKTNGGTEYVARVVRAASDELKWSPQKNALKIIFVAGNEPATQDGKYKLKDVCSATIAKGIIVNTIFCGDEATGRSTGWADAANWADGRFAAIDQDKGTVAIVTPFDKKLADLGTELNTTYLAYGTSAPASAARQVAQDANAETAGAPVAAQRALAKASPLYRNAGWDMVDAARESRLNIKEMKEEDLPAKMKKMTPDERQAFVDQQAKRREALQKEIQDLGLKRDTYVKEQMAKQGLTEKAAFDGVLRAAIRQQAQAKDFQFENPPDTQPAK